MQADVGFGSAAILSAMNRHPNIVNVDEVQEVEDFTGEHWGSAYKVLTPVMGARAGRLGANVSRVPKGHSACPFHAHQLEDEIFFVLSGRGLFRYGDEVREIRAGDCIACPAGTGVAHQLANPHDEDLVYLAVGRDDPNEVCVYPDNGKVMVRSLSRVGFLEPADYMKGEPAKPKIFALAEQAKD
jgi:uncharacterized cupin superfamily protein